MFLFYKSLGFYLGFVLAMMYNGLSVEARTTAGWDRLATDHTVLNEYISGVLGKYLLVIEYLIAQYPELPVFVSSWMFIDLKIDLNQSIDLDF